MPHAFNTDAIRWQPFGDFPHFAYSILQVDLPRRIADVLFRFDAGQQIVLHRHKALNHTFVIRGEHRLYEMERAGKLLFAAINVNIRFHSALFLH